MRLAFRPSLARGVVNRGRVAPGKIVKCVRGRDRELSFGQRAANRCRRRLDFFSLVREVIDEEVFAQPFGLGVEVWEFLI